MKIYTTERRMPVAKMMDSDYESGLSSDEIENLIMEEEATRRNAERLLLMDIEDEKAVLHFVANLDKVDAVTGTVDFNIDDASTHMVEVANSYSAKNSNSMGIVEIDELCNFKCGRKEGQPRWRCKCVTIPNTNPLSTMELALFKLKEWAKKINAANMLKKKAVEAFNEHCEDVYVDMRMERAVESETLPEEELAVVDEDVDYDGDNDDEIDYRNIDGMELESSSDDEVQHYDELTMASDNTCSLSYCNKPVNGEGVVSENDPLENKYCSEECLRQGSHEGFDASGSMEDLLDGKQVREVVSEEREESEESADDTDDEPLDGTYILYHLVTDGDSGYEKVELNRDTLQQGWKKIKEKFERIPSLHDFPYIVDLPPWPNCCVESQSHKKCNCGEFVKEKVVNVNKEVRSLRIRDKLDKRLEYTHNRVELMIKTRLEMLEKLKKEKKTVVNKKTVVKKKTTEKGKRKRSYEICSDLVFHEKDFCHDVEGKRGKRFACPICEEPAQRKTNAMQHAIADHHCTVWKINPKTKIEEKFVLRHFKCMHPDCKWQGTHSPLKFQQHMSGVHCRDFIRSNTCDDEYYVQGYETCIVRPLKHGCDRSDCTSYAPCAICTESYGCSNMTCGCWLPRPTCSSDSCNTCKVREGK